MGLNRLTTIPDAAGLCGGFMEVQLLEIPDPFVKATGQEFDRERSAFLEGLKETVLTDDDPADDEAPF